MLLTNERLDKIAACRADFMSRGMLASDPSPGKSLSIWIHPGRQLTLQPGANTEDEDDDGADVVGPSVLSEVVLAKVPSKYDYI